MGALFQDSDRLALAEFIDKALDGDCGYGVGEFLAGGILGFLTSRHELHAAFEATPAMSEVADSVSDHG